jgi:hypothetical protein
MRRREVLGLIGASVMWPVAVSAQQKLSHRLSERSQWRIGAAHTGCVSAKDA